MSNKQAGDFGEQEIVGLVLCPNCHKKLMLLPQGYPLFDIQCTGCNFRAQVKTNASKPKKEIFGATWDVMDKVTKSGYFVPPLIVNFKWVKKDEIKQEVRFYPFVPKVNLKKYLAQFKSGRKALWMFNYVGIDKLPYFVLFNK
jgi:DNA-directed RNA polymerase subunit RPC12/RpoP